MKLILQNSSLAFAIKAGLQGNIVLPISYVWMYDGIVAGTGPRNISGITSGNNVRAYDISGLPVGTKINISAGKVSNMNNWNADQQRTTRRYMTTKGGVNTNTTIDNSYVSFVPDAIVQSDQTEYTMNADNTIDFAAVTIEKISENETMLITSGDSAPIVTIDVSDVVVSGTNEIPYSSIKGSHYLLPDGNDTYIGNTSCVYDYDVVGNSWYFVYTRFDRKTTDPSACVVFLDEVGNIIGTVSTITQFQCYGGAMAVFVPAGTKKIRVQGQSNKKLDNDDISTRVFEAEVV